MVLGEAHLPPVRIAPDLGRVSQTVILAHSYNARASMARYTPGVVNNAYLSPLKSVRKSGSMNSGSSQNVNITQNSDQLALTTLRNHITLSSRFVLSFVVILKLTLVLRP